MSTSKHTPGEWEWSEGSRFIRRYWNGNFYPIASVLYPAWHEDTNKGSEEARANGRLIATAPDLLATCEKIVDYRNRSGPVGFQLEKADYFFEMARQVIFKATGEDVPV